MPINSLISRGSSAAGRTALCRPEALTAFGGGWRLLRGIRTLQAELATQREEAALSRALPFLLHGRQACQLCTKHSLSAVRHPLLYKPQKAVQLPKVEG